MHVQASSAELSQQSCQSCAPEGGYPPNDSLVIVDALGWGEEMGEACGY